MCPETCDREVVSGSNGRFTLCCFLMDFTIRAISFLGGARPGLSDRESLSDGRRNLVGCRLPLAAVFGTVDVSTVPESESRCFFPIEN